MHAENAAADGPSHPATPLFLFVAFSKMALSGFGGVMPFAYHHVVERRKWHTPAEFAEMLALGQVLPGPTICNVAVMIGWRKRGFAGALASLAGMLVGPAIAVVLLGMLYDRFEHVAQVRQALGGMSAVAAGLIIAMAVNMGTGVLAQRKTRGIGLAAEAALGLLAFAAVGIAHRPMLLVIGVLGPLATALAWRRRA